MKDAPKRKPGKQGTTRAERQKLPRCGAKNRSGKPCQIPAGRGTSHPGEGRCKLHGGVGQKPSGRYAEINASPRLKELIELHAAEQNPGDLLPELTLLRALCVSYIERHDQVTSALLAWHASHTTGYQEAVALWREQLAQWVEEKDHGQAGEPPALPVPLDFESKPRQLPDILGVASYLDKIGSMAERIQKREAEQKVSLTDLNRVLEQLGVEVVMAVKEVIPDDADQSRSPTDLRAELVGAIERRWGTVRV